MTDEKNPSIRELLRDVPGGVDKLIERIDSIFGGKSKKVIEDAELEDPEDIKDAKLVWFTLSAALREKMEDGSDLTAAMQRALNFAGMSMLSEVALVMVVMGTDALRTLWSERDFRLLMRMLETSGMIGSFDNPKVPVAEVVEASNDIESLAIQAATRAQRPS